MSANTLSRGAGPAGGTVTLRRGAATFAGSIIAAASGLVLAVVVGRSLGPAGAGVFFSIVSLFTILSTVLKLGADTAQLWRIPRLLGEGRGADLVPTLALAVIPAAIASVVAAAGLVAASDLVVQRLSGVEAGLGVRAQLLWAAGALIFMAPLSNLIAATRGLGQVTPFIAVQNIGLPLGRLVAVATVLAAGAGGVTVMAAWSAPVVVAFVLAALLLHREVGRVRAAGQPSAPPRSLRELNAELQRFAVPRWATASIEVLLVAVNTLVVGLLQGPAAAGVFGALSRFVTTGTLAEQTVRILVAPRFSALLAANDLGSAGRLYSVTTPWIVLVSWPVFVTLASGAPATLSLFGASFEAGAQALALLAVTMCASQLAGNVQTILLMSGRSGLQLVNKVTAVVVLLGLDALLIPRWGIVGAAVAWAVSILVDTGLATLEVFFGVGLPLRSPVLPRVMVSSALVFATPTILLVRVLDGGLPGLAAALLIGAALYLPLVWRWRDALHLTALRSGSSVEQELAGVDEEPGAQRG